MEYKFQKFIGRSDGYGKPAPKRMIVGEIVVRKPCSSTYRYQLKYQMSRLLRENGWGFSVHDEADCFAIRRDK